MFGEMSKQFGGMFGKLGQNMCKLTMNGGIAVKTNNGYKTYNVKKGTLTNVTNFCFPVGDEFFFVMPTSKVDIGDIILVDGKPKCVIGSDNKVITVIDYETSEIKQILPERHIFMGAAYFYGKIVSLFGGNFKSTNGIQRVMKMMMMSQMFGGQITAGAGNGGNIMQTMLMMQMMNGDNSMFDDMFSNLSYDFKEIEVDDDDEDEDTADEDEELAVRPKKSTTTKTKK